MWTTAGMGLQQRRRASRLQNNSLWSCFLAQALKTSWVVIICIRFKLCNKHFSLLMPDCSQLQLKSPMDHCDERPKGSERGTGGSGELVPASCAAPAPGHQPQKINLLLSLWSHHALQSHPSVVLSVCSSRAAMEEEIYSIPLLSPQTHQDGQGAHTGSGGRGEGAQLTK